MNAMAATVGLRPWRERLAAAIRGEDVEGVTVRDDWHDLTAPASPAGAVAGFGEVAPHPDDPGCLRWTLRTRSVTLPVGEDDVASWHARIGHVDAGAGQILVGGVQMDVGRPVEVTFLHRDLPWNMVVDSWAGGLAEYRDAAGRTIYPPVDLDRLP